MTPEQRAALIAAEAGLVAVHESLRVLESSLEVAEPPPPTYSLTVSPETVNEGESVTITLQTTGVAAGTAVPYVLSGVGQADLLAMMRRKGIRRIPVATPDGVLLGLVTMDDILEILAEQLRSVVLAIESEQMRERRLRE